MYSYVILPRGSTGIMWNTPRGAVICVHSVDLESHFFGENDMKRSSAALTMLSLVLFAMPGAAPAGEKAERVYEMRTYYAPEGRLDDLHIG